MSQTCPPGDTGRYFRQSSPREPRESLDSRTGHQHPYVRQAVHSEDVLSTSSADTQVVAKKVAPKKPERKKLKKAQETSSNMDHLIQEQVKLERELKQLQEIRERLIPPLDLRDLNANHMNGSITNGELYPSDKRFIDPSLSRNGQNEQLSRSNYHKTPSSGHSTSGPGHSRSRPGLTSDDSVDREVEGLLREVMLLRDSEDDTSPLKHEYYSPESPDISHRNGTRRASPGMLVNGYHSEVIQPNATNQHVQQNYSPPQFNPQFVSPQRNQPAGPVASQTDKIQQFCLLKKQEIYWMSQIRSRRHILEQKLDPLVRQDVEEQYFYSQEELSRVEKAIADLFQSLSPQEVQWLIKNGMAPSSPEYIRSPYNLHALQTNNQASPSISYNQYDQQFLPREQQQQVPYPVAPGPFVNGINVPQRVGYQQTDSLLHYSANFSPSGNVPNQFQDTANASAPSFTKPPSTDKETQTFNGFHAQNGASPAQRMYVNVETLQSANLQRDPRDLDTKPRDKDQGVDDSRSARQLPGTGNSELRETLQSANLQRDPRDLDARSRDKDQHVDDSRSARQLPGPGNSELRETMQSANLQRDPRDLDARSRDDIRSARQLPEPGNNQLRIAADQSQAAPMDNVSLEGQEAATVNQVVPKQQQEKPRSQLAREGSNNEEAHSNVYNRQKPAAVKQPSFDDHEVVKLKEKLEHEQREFRASLEREQQKFMEEQRRLQEEEERQNEWIRQQEAERENQQRMLEDLAAKARDAETGEQELSVDEVRLI